MRRILLIFFLTAPLPLRLSAQREVVQDPVAQPSPNVPILSAPEVPVPTEISAEPTGPPVPEPAPNPSLESDPVTIQPAAPELKAAPPRFSPNLPLEAQTNLRAASQHPGIHRPAGEVEGRIQNVRSQELENIRSLKTPNLPDSSLRQTGQNIQLLLESAQPLTDAVLPEAFSRIQNAAAFRNSRGAPRYLPNPNLSVPGVVGEYLRAKILDTQKQFKTAAADIQKDPGVAAEFKELLRVLVKFQENRIPGWSAPEIRFESRPGEIENSAVADYDPTAHRVRFGLLSAYVPPRLLASLYAHELYHAYERAGKSLQEETRAHQIQAVIAQAILEGERKRPDIKTGDSYPPPEIRSYLESLHATSRTGDPDGDLEPLDPAEIHRLTLESAMRKLVRSYREGSLEHDIQRRYPDYPDLKILIAQLTDFQQALRQAVQKLRRLEVLGNLEMQVPLKIFNENALRILSPKTLADLAEQKIFPKLLSALEQLALRARTGLRLPLEVEARPSQPPTPAGRPQMRPGIPSGQPSWLATVSARLKTEGDLILLAKQEFERASGTSLETVLSGDGQIAAFLSGNSIFREDYLNPVRYFRDHALIFVDLAPELWKLSREYNVLPEELEALIRTHSLERLADKPETAEGLMKILRQILSGHAWERMASKLPHNNQGRFIREIISHIRAKSGKSVEEISRSGTFAYFRFSGDRPHLLTVSRDPDLFFSQRSAVIQFYITLEKNGWKISGHAGRAPPLKKWLAAGIPGISFSD